MNAIRQKNGVALWAIVLAIGCVAMAALFVGGGNRAHATVNSWESVGGDLVPAGTTGNISMVINNGTPYVAYMDNGLPGVKVKKYNGSGWEDVGASPGSGFYVSLSFYGGAPYIAISDAAYGYKVTVKMFNGTDWVLVGSPGFSPGGAEYVSLYIYNGTPYVAFADTGNAYKPAVMKLNAGVWEPVGSPGFAGSRVYDLSLYVNNNIPYVTYRVAAENNKVPVMMYNGTDWIAVGGGGVISGRGEYPSLYIDNGNLYVALKDSTGSFIGTVMMYNGSNWEKVGGADFSSSEVQYTSLFIYNGTPYVAYSDYLQSNKVTVKKYNGSSWETIGNAGFSVGMAQSISLIVDNGTPYISYKETSRVAVKKLVTRYNVTYHGNGHTGGSVPVDGVIYNSGSGAVVRGNTGALVKTGHTFTGWDTDADGNGTDYSASDTVTIGASDVTVYAQWAVNNYSVTYEGSGATSGSAPAGGSSPYNTGITLPGNTGSLAKTGYTFTGWNTAANGSGTNYPAGSPYTIGAANVTLYAKWTANPYTVSFESNGGSAVISQTINYGSTAVQPTVPTKTGHTIEGWYSDSGLSTAYNFATPIGAADMTLYAKWSVNSYTVTYDSNGTESGTAPSMGTHLYNSSVTLPDQGDLAKTGYTFAGWNTAADGNGTNYAAGSTYTVGAVNVTLYAKWTVKPYTVSFERNGGSSVASQETNYGTAVVQPTAPMRTGHTFVGWYSDSELTTAYNFATPIGAADITLYAKWGIISYTVTYDDNGATSGTAPSMGTHLYNSGVTLPDSGDLAKTGHTFAGWNTVADGNGTDYLAGSTYTVGAVDVTLYAKWTVKPYTVSFESDGGSSVANQATNYGTAVVQPTAPMKTGYTFAGWYSDSGLTAAYNFAALIGAADITLYAKWDINSYTVTYDGNGAASGSVPGDSVHVYDTDVAVPGNTGGLAKIGHTFAGWNTAADGNGTNYSADNTFTIGAADVTLYAKWTVNPYTVSFNSNDGSSVASQTILYDTTAVQPAAATKTGHTFAGWYSDSVLTVAFDFATPIGAGDVTLYAKWTINSYTVTYDDNGAASGSVPAFGSHMYDTDVTLPSSGDLAKTEYTFAGWNTAADGNGTNYPAGSTYTVSAADVTLYAEWTVNSYTVTYDGNGNTGGSVPVDSSHEYDTDITLPGNPGTLAKTGYTLAGWNTTANGSGSGYAVDETLRIGAANVTLYAQWTINTYMVSFNSNGGSSIASQTINYDTTAVQPTAPTKTGHTFAGWYSGSDLTEAYNFATPIGAADVTIYAKWTINPYAVSFESNGGSSVTSQTILFGNTVVQPSEPTKTGYVFTGWYTDPSLTAAFNFSTPIGAADVMLYAKWLSADALLSDLSVDQGTLHPGFSPTEANYAITVAREVSSLNIFLSKGDPIQSITVTGATYGSVTNDVYSYNVSNLVVGPNLIQITVTAENQDQNTYRVTVNVSGEMGEPVALDSSINALTFPGGLAIRLPDGLSIHPGATLTVRDSNATPTEEVMLTVAGQVIDFQFYGMTIDQPIEITLGYDVDFDPSKLAIFYYNESTSKWEYQPSQVTGNGIKTTVSHFSTYGVLSDTTAPDEPTVTSGEKTTNSITLHLGASDDSGVEKYLIYRDGTLVGETVGSTYVDTGLSASRTYTYTAKAVDMLDNISNDSEGISVTTNGGGNNGNNGNNGGSVHGGMASSPDKVTSINGTLTLPVGKLGEVSLSNKVKIVLPAGASDEELKLTIEQVSDTHELIKSNDKLLSPVFEIMKNFTKNFSKDVTLTFTFDPTSVTDNQKPSVFYYDESKMRWVEVGGEVNGNSITASVNHFTKFAVFAVDQEANSTPDAKPTINLSDISGHWAEAGIRAAVDAGIVKGFADGKFQPDAEVTRAQFAVMLMNALKPQGKGTELTFADTAEIGVWAQAAVAQAVEVGIVNGYGDGRFRPAANISRAELAVMIARAYGADIETEVSAPTGFSDDGDIPAWAYSAVSTVRQLGIVQGRSGGLFAPNSTATRAEAAVMILNLLQKMN